MFKIKTTLVASVLLALLIGCAGTKFSFDRARQVQVGMTKSQVQGLMGKPYMVTSRDGKEIWVWSYANGMTGGHQSISFIFKDGKVESGPAIPDSFK